MFLGVKGGGVPGDSECGPRMVAKTASPCARVDATLASSAAISWSTPSACLGALFPDFPLYRRREFLLCCDFLLGLEALEEAGDFALGGELMMLYH